MSSSPDKPELTSEEREELRRTDPTEYATVWGLEQPELRDLLSASYRTGDVIADARRMYNSLEFRETLAILSQLGQPPHTGRRLLDVGCGNGSACYAFARAGYHVTGVDISEGKLAGLQGARSLMRLDGISFRVINRNMDHLALANTTFDVIYMRQALHHSSDPVETVGRLGQMLVPGGIFGCIRDHVILNQKQLKQFLAHHPFQPITQDEHAYTLGTYRMAFHKAGLIKRVELFPFDSDINFAPSLHADLVQYLSRRLHLNLENWPRLKKFVLRALAFKHQLTKDQLYSFFYQKPG
jgi:2-polyprenyl-3-methyl-5-hydroxy-6-metoxy-1,4-benzoquinol methylase